MTEPRTTSTTPEFPFKSARVCYLEVKPDGTVSQLRYADEKREALARAEAGESRVYAAWPGEYRTDLFLVDE